MSDELKIVIFLKGNRGSIGIQSPNCDPVFSTHEGDLQSLLQVVPAKVEEARTKWDSNPRYPKCETKLEPEPAARVTIPARSARQAEDIQQRLPL